MIGKSVQTRLFSAVFLVIFLMTLGVGITFFLSSRWYVQYTARKETEHLIRMVQSESDRLRTDPAYTSSDSKENTREASKALLRSVRLQLRDQPYNGTFLVFNSRQKLVFPQSSNDQNIYPISALEEQCRQMIQSGELVSGKPFRVLLSEDFWYISMYVFPSTITLIKTFKNMREIFLRESRTIILYQKDQRVSICTHTDQNLVISISQTV